MLVEVLRGDGIQRRAFVNACVVYQHVEFSEGSAGLGEEALDVVGLGYICLDVDRCASLFLNAPNDSLASGFAGGVVDDDRGAFRCQMLGD
jgi:hypothetical protein